MTRPLALLALTLTPALASAASFQTFVPQASRLDFVSRQMGVPVEGRFSRFDVQLAFDPDRPEAARLALAVDLASVDAGSQEANEEVKGKNWFNVGQHPQARFVSSAVRSLGGGRYEVRGQLQIKGRSKEVSAPFSFKAQGGRGVFQGAFVFKRLDYGVGEGPWGDPGTVADTVEVKFQVTATSAPSQARK